MIEVIPLRAVPNQSLVARPDGQVYALDIVTRRNRLYITIRVNGETIARNRALLSFAPIEGDLILVDNQGNDDPTYQQLGQRFLLTYWPPADE